MRLSKDAMARFGVKWIPSSIVGDEESVKGVGDPESSSMLSNTVVLGGNTTICGQMSDRNADKTVEKSSVHKCQNLTFDGPGKCPATVDHKIRI